MKNSKGITLIALIITIIVMVILAAVALTFSVEEKGVISKAGEAKLVQAQKEEEERVRLAESAAKTAGLGKIIEANLDKELKAEFGENGYTLTKRGTDFVVIITESGNEYIIGGSDKLNDDDDDDDDDNGALERIYYVSNGSWGEEYVTNEEDIPSNATVTAKLYKTDYTFAPNTPWHWNCEYETILQERNAYKLVIEGNGNVPAVLDMENGGFAAWGNDVFEALESDEETLKNSDNFIWYLNEVEIKGVSNVPVGALGYCISVAKVTLDNTVKTIGAGAFMECNKLKTINLENVTDIGSYAFSAAKSLKNITLPKAITTIKESTFDFSGLVSIDLSNVTTIESGAFHECEDLESVELSDELLVIEEEVFGSCESLKSIDLKNVTELKTYSLRGCTSLEHIDLKKVHTLGTDVFSECSNLKTIKIQSDTFKFSNGYGNGAFGYSLPDGLIIYVPNQEIADSLEGLYDKNKITVVVQ